MTPRRSASALIAVFCIGGILGPVWHQVDHRHPHTHGPGPSANLSHEARASSERHSHPHPHRTPLTQPTPTKHRLVNMAGVTDHGHTSAPEDVPESRSPNEESSLPLDHGRFTAAHFGLAIVCAQDAPPTVQFECCVEAAVCPPSEPRSLFKPLIPPVRPPPAPTRQRQQHG